MAGFIILAEGSLSEIAGHLLLTSHWLATEGPVVSREVLQPRASSQDCHRANAKAVVKLSRKT
jgi:hypothetical protein